MTIGDWLTTNRRGLPKGEALLFLAFVLHREKSYLMAHPEHTLSREEGVTLDQCVKRRKKHEPFSYIPGEKEFFRLPFFVTPATLIPRPETEILVEYVLNRIENRESRIKNHQQISLIDIGTGSGCIPISIRKTLQSKHPDIFSHTKFLATDISPDALSVARRNTTRHGMEKLIDFQHSDLLSDIPESYFRTHSFILTANLPYLSKEIYATSSKDVRLYEPQSALQGDEHDGTTPIRTLLNQYLEKKCSAKQYTIILEISPEQSRTLLGYGKTLFPKSNASLLPDLSGRDRFLIIENY